jgi:23S rRNA pseudouridine1911/1915/1917 synthase
VAREWLAELLGVEPTRAAVRRLVMAGALRMDGRPLRAPDIIRAGAALVMTVRPDLVRREAPPALEAARILYEDDALIVVDKPPGLPTVATADPRRAHLVGLVEQFLAAREANTRPAGRLGVHQRLDRDTSGVVVLVKDPAANAALAEQFASRAVQKTYLALTGRPARLPPERWRGEEPVDEPPAAARPARTDFSIAEVCPRGLLVEARPRTGRKHQIRIHLARAGLAILGDATYGRAGGAPRLMLHAARLELRHPLTGAALSVESPLPADFLACLEALRAPAPAVARATPVAGSGRGRRPR